MNILPRLQLLWVRIPLLFSPFLVNYSKSLLHFWLYWKKSKFWDLELLLKKNVLSLNDRVNKNLLSLKRVETIKIHTCEFARQVYLLNKTPVESSLVLSREKFQKFKSSEIDIKSSQRYKVFWVYPVLPYSLHVFTFEWIFMPQRSREIEIRYF